MTEQERARRSGEAPGVNRRVVLRATGGIALLAVLPGCGGTGGRAGQTDAGSPVGEAGFLDERELATLRAFVERMIPEDADPGALSGCCAEAIDQLLAAFLTTPPRIYAGAPFSDRGGHPVNEFEAFLPLDAYEELSWRLTIEGSQGLPEREFNGPVKGWQAIYREGLARLDQRATDAGFEDFAAAPAPVRDTILGDSSDPLVAELVDVGYLHTLDAMYGPPEYGGNCGLVGWAWTDFDGDVQPRGYTVDQVVNADNPGVLDGLLPPSYHEGDTGAGKAATTPAARVAPAGAATLPLAPATDAVAAAMLGAGGRWSALRASLTGSRDAAGGDDA